MPSIVRSSAEQTSSIRGTCGHHLKPCEQLLVLGGKPLVGAFGWAEGLDLIGDGRGQPCAFGMGFKGCQRIDVDPDREQDIAAFGQFAQGLAFEPQIDIFGDRAGAEAAFPVSCVLGWNSSGSP
jgi:hypothetical protein